jgi:uncharacterized protein YodC (DUF2158 family)
MQQEEDPQEGDPVQLYGDGPVMYVLGRSQRLATCEWVDEYHRIHHGTFELRVLRKVMPPQVGIE